MTKKRMYVCSIEAAMDVIGGKWKPHILWKIRDGPLRFGGIQGKMPAISQIMLTRQLRVPDNDRLVSRTEYPGMPPPCRVCPDDAGRDRHPAFHIDERPGERGADRPGRRERVISFLLLIGSGGPANRGW